MKVLLVDVDSRWASLPLMKVSRFHKDEGDDVSLIRLSKTDWRHKSNGPVSLKIDAPMEAFDKVSISCIFRANASNTLSMAVMFESMGAEVEVGGTGVDIHKTLPGHIEHLKPDYSLYGLDYSMGFLTRGCIRACPWCVVPKKEGKIRVHSPLSEFLELGHNKVMLLDNNLLALPEHRKLLMELLDRRLKVCFTQGLDIRLVDSDNALLLKHIRYRDTEFKVPRLYFSWDLLNIEAEVIEGIKILKKRRIHSSHQLFYILTGFNVKAEDYTWKYFLENDWYRFELLKKFGVLPFIMVYNDRSDIPLLNAFQRWVNWMFKAKKKSLGLLRSFTTYLGHDHPNVWKELKPSVDKKLYS